MAWQIVCEPKGKNPGRQTEQEDNGVERGQNEGGMVVYLQGPSGNREEVSRVAWVRRNSRNPSNSFDKQLGMEVDKAREGARLLNELLGEAAEDGEKELV